MNGIHAIFFSKNDDFFSRITGFFSRSPDFSPLCNRVLQSVRYASMFGTYLRSLKIIFIGDRRRRPIPKATKKHLQDIPDFSPIYRNFLHSYRNFLQFCVAGCHKWHVILEFSPKVEKNSRVEKNSCQTQCIYRGDGMLRPGGSRHLRRASSTPGGPRRTRLVRGSLPNDGYE